MRVITYPKFCKMRCKFPLICNVRMVRVVVTTIAVLLRILIKKLFIVSIMDEPVIAAAVNLLFKLSSFDIAI